jgi:hypothetical protein
MQGAERAAHERLMPANRRAIFGAICALGDDGKKAIQREEEENLMKVKSKVKAGGGGGGLHP